jgi:hypothetical protein
MILHEVSLHTRDGSWWVMPAAKPMVGKDGTALRDDAGKVRYAPIVAFVDKGVRDRFSQGVIEALRRAMPQVFATEGVA